MRRPARATLAAAGLGLAVAVAVAVAVGAVAARASARAPRWTARGADDDTSAAAAAAAAAAVDADADAGAGAAAASQQHRQQHRQQRRTCARDYEPCAGGLPSPVLLAPCCSYPDFFCFRRGAYFSQCRPRNDVVAAAAAATALAAAADVRRPQQQQKQQLNMLKEEGGGGGARRKHLCAPTFGVCAAGPGADSRLPCCDAHHDACILTGSLFHQCIPSSSMRGSRSIGEEAASSASTSSSAGTFATATASTRPGSSGDAYASASASAKNKDGSSADADSQSASSSGSAHHHHGRDGRHGRNRSDDGDNAWYLLPHTPQPPTSSPRGGHNPHRDNNPFPFDWPPGLPYFSFLPVRDGRARGYTRLTPLDKLLPLLSEWTPDWSLNATREYRAEHHRQVAPRPWVRQWRSRWQGRTPAPTVLISAAVPSLSIRERRDLRRRVEKALPASGCLLMLRGGKLFVGTGLEDFWDAAMVLAALPETRSLRVDQGRDVLDGRFGKKRSLTDDPAAGAWR